MKTIVSFVVAFMIVLFINVKSHAQIRVNLTAIPPIGSQPIACNSTNENLYTMTVTVLVGQVNSVTLTVDFITNNINGNCNIDGYRISNVTGWPVTYNQVPQSYDFVFPGNTSAVDVTYNISYRLDIDCSVNPVSSTYNSPQVEQHFSAVDPGNVPVLFDASFPLPYNSVLQQAHITVRSIYMIGNQVTPISTYYLGPAQVAHVFFDNIGNNVNPTPITFSFNINEGSCTATILVGNIDIFVSDGTNTTLLQNNYNQGDPLTVSLNSTQFLRFDITIQQTGCLTNCSNYPAILSWGCGSGCTLCHTTTTTIPINIVDATPIRFIRTLPTVNVVPPWDYSCIREDGSAAAADNVVQWEYRVSNNEPFTATQTVHKHIEHVQIGLAYDGGANGLTAIAAGSFSVTTSNFTGTWAATPVTLPLTTYPNMNCVTDRIISWQMDIYDMDPGAIITFSFQTSRCCPDVDLMNQPKSFNQWRMSGTYWDECGTGFAVGQPGFSSNAGRIAPEGINNTADMDLRLEFFPTTSDMYGGGAGSNADFQIGVKKLFVDEFALNVPCLGFCARDNVVVFPMSTGNSAAGCPCFNGIVPRGMIRVEITCDEGLTLVNGNDPNLAFRFGIPSFPLRRLDALPCYDIVADAPTNGCDQTTYTYYIDLQAEINQLVASGQYNTAFNAYYNLFHFGEVNFTIHAGCPSDCEPAHFNVAFYLDPGRTNTNCGNYTCAAGNGGYDCTNTDCCWIPLSSVDHSIHIHCPGCLTPGIIVETAAMERVTFGSEDNNNDGYADNPVTPIGPAYLATHPEVRRNISFVNDEVELHLHAHFEDGVDPINIPINGGFNYAWMLSQGLPLDFLYLDNIIPEANNTNFDLDVAWFTIEIVDGNNALNNCVSPTILTPSALLQTNDVGSSRHFFFKIHVSDIQAFCPMFQGFMPWQEYELRVHYRVCGNKTNNADYIANLTGNVIKSEINDFMFLSGSPNFTNSPNTPWNPSANVFPDDNCPDPIPAPCYDNYEWRCEPSGTIHYFATVTPFLTNTLTDVALSCEKTITSDVTIRVAGGYPNLFRNEFRPLPMEWNQWTFNIPNPTTSHLTVPAQLAATGNELTVFRQYPSPPPPANDAGFPYAERTSPTPPLLPITFVPINNSFSLTHGQFTYEVARNGVTSFTNLVLGEDFVRQRTFYNAMPDCHNLPPDFDRNYIEANFLFNTPGGCAQNSNAFLSDAGADIDVHIPDPQLDFDFTPNPIAAGDHNICWYFEVTNTAGAGNPAPFTYLQFDVAALAPAFTNWTIQQIDCPPLPPNPCLNCTTVVVPQAGGFFPLGPSAPNSRRCFLLCADYNDCTGAIQSNPFTIPINWGWNCTGYPTAINIDICENTSTDHIDLYDLISGLAPISYGSVPNVVTQCTTLVVTACFAASGEGGVIINEININPLPSTGIILSNTSLTVERALNNCGNVQGTPEVIQLSPAGNGYNANGQMPATMEDLGFDGGTGYMHGPAGTVDYIRFTFSLDISCGINSPFNLPQISLVAENFCGDPITATTVNTSISASLATPFDNISHTVSAQPLSACDVPTLVTVTITNNSTTSYPLHPGNEFHLDLPPGFTATTFSPGYTSSGGPTNFVWDETVINTIAPSGSLPITFYIDYDHTVACGNHTINTSLVANEVLPCTPSNCAITHTYSAFPQVVSVPVPDATFICPPSPLSVNQPYQFFSNTTNCNYYFWDFGTIPLSTSTADDPVFTYTNVGTYIVTLIAQANNSPVPAACSSTTNCTVIVEGIPEPCDDLETVTQGGWGACPHGHNPASYLVDNFGPAFPSPNFLTVGCSTHILQFTSPVAVSNFLPCGSTPAALTNTIPIVDPLCSAVNTVFASQVITLTLNVGFDLYDPDFASSDCNLADAIIDNPASPYDGWTVQALLNYANDVLGGCITLTPAQISTLNDLIDDINNCFDGNGGGCNLLTCDANCNPPARISGPGNDSPKSECTIEADFTFLFDPVKSLITFYDKSTSSCAITSYTWQSCETGQTSTDAQPTFYFSTSGTYTICLTVVATCPSGETCTDGICKDIEVILPCENIIPEFVYSIDNCKVNFHNTSFTNCAITSLLWDFGDGMGTSTDPDPVYAFGQPGIYQVCLKLDTKCEDGQKCNTTICHWILVTGCGEQSCLVHADYNYDVYDCLSLFHDQSIHDGTILSWNWNFDDTPSGNNNISTLANPIHYFTYPGSYNVCLKVTVAYQGITCSDDICYPVYVSEVCEPCEMECNFEYEIDKCVVNFNGSSSSNSSITSWYWDFGDGTHSNLENPVHTFNYPGTYHVCMTAISQDNGETCVCQKCYDIVITEECLPGECSVTALFDYSVDKCNATFWDISTSLNNTLIYDWVWGFGDGTFAAHQDMVTHLYSAPGNYTVTMTVYGKAGVLFCQDSYTKEITINDECSPGRLVPLNVKTNAMIIPNPNTGMFDLLLDSETEDNLKVCIRDAASRCLYKDQHYVIKGKNKFSYNMKALAKGVYFIELSGSKDFLVLKLVIQ